MKNILLTLAVVGLLTGCSHNYVITLNNNHRLMATTKPRLHGSSYFFKDSQGQDAFISAGSVKEIAPASMVKEEKTPFKPETR